MLCAVNRTSLNLTSADIEDALDWFHVGCAPFTILLNAGVLYIAIRYIDLSVRPNQWIVMSMTVSDMMYAIVYMVTKPVTNCFNRTFCRVYYISTWSFSCMSVISLLLLNVDKFISLHYPLRYRQIVTDRWIGVQLSLCWSVCVGFAVMVFSGVGVSFPENAETECYVAVEEWAYLIMLVCFLTVPMLASLKISIYVFCVAQRMSGRLPGLPESRVEQRRVRQHLMKRVLFVFSSTLWTSATMLPYRILFLSIALCYQICYGCNCKPPAIERLTYAMWFLLPLSTVFNPVITVVTQRIYRQHLNWLLGRFAWWARFGADDQKSSRRGRFRSFDTRSCTLSEEASGIMKSAKQSGQLFEKL